MSSNKSQTKTALPPFSKGGTEGGFLPLLNLHAAKIRIYFTAEKPRRIYGIETALRGRLGFHLKRVCCPYPDFSKRPCDGCELIENCLYLTIFAPEPPSAIQNGASQPTRRRHPTRPYVIEADGPDNRIDIISGERGDASFTLFGPAIRYCSLFIEAAVAGLRDLGLQPETVDIQRPAAAPVDDKVDSSATIAWPLSHWTGDPPANEIQTLNLRCLTPVRIIPEESIFSENPDIPFLLFVKAAIRRLRDLKRAYGDDRNMGQADQHFYRTAEAVSVKNNNLYWGMRKRRSHRQNQDVFLNGLKGDIVFEGSLHPYVPLLKAAEIVHIGKSATAGNGRISLDFP